MGSVALRIAVAGTALFWVLVSIGGAANWQYKQYQEYLSALAADGIPNPQWALAALVVLAMSHAVLVPTLSRWHPFLGVVAGLAALALVFVACLRIPCPPHARYCSPEPANLPVDVGHAAGVVVYTSSILALLLMTLLQMRAGAHRRVSWVPVTVAAVVLTAVCSGELLTLSGLAQRGWLLIGQLAVVFAAAVAAGELARRERLLSKERLAAPTLAAVDA